MYKIYPNSRLRKNKGAVLAEFGPALLLLPIVGFFPLLDLVYLAMAYCCKQSSLDISGLTSPMQFQYFTQQVQEQQLPLGI
jgi:hypothetical protein